MLGGIDTNVGAPGRNAAQRPSIAAIPESGRACAPRAPWSLVDGGRAAAHGTHASPPGPAGHPAPGSTSGHEAGWLSRGQHPQGSMASAGSIAA